MYFWHRLWSDEGGAVVTAELAVLATVGVIGGVVGLSTFAHAVNAELTDTAFAFRSLDQSYSYYGFSSRGAWVAGSAYTQVDVATAHAELATVAGVEATAHARAAASAEARANAEARGQRGYVPCEVVPCPPDRNPSLRPLPDSEVPRGHHDAERSDQSRKPVPSADDLPDPPRPQVAPKPAPKVDPKRRNERDDRDDREDRRKDRDDDDRDDDGDRRHEA